MNKIYIGIDNGVTGSVGVLSEQFNDYFATPIKKEQNYTKKKDIISRLDAQAFSQVLDDILKMNNARAEDCLCIMERPLTSEHIRATLSAARCFEAELVLIESKGLPHIFIDSREWQRDLLPSGIKGSDEQKRASRDIGLRLFPFFENFIKKHKDADGILIAEWAKRKNL